IHESHPAWFYCLWRLAVPCAGVHVFVRDEKRYAVLFQSVVLPCQYNSVSTQTAVVQWVYKSYCRDRSGGSYDTGMTASYLDCSDNSRTVRTVASISGSSVTLSEYYKNRDISIINKADLRIGEVQWGDSGVYICKVVISDDLEGQNEASVELLVLGKLSELSAWELSLPYAIHLFGCFRNSSSSAVIDVPPNTFLPLAWFKHRARDQNQV
uniref:Si:zfos-1011f11.2 n=1 Tax=Salarias fasciatus TaxID=181472 RepID=A0A672FXW8_SALFA